jgi:pyridoxal phosphate enzyme (YggS family)
VDELTRRRAEIALHVEEVRGRITRACAAVGRDPAGVVLIGVTKTFPAADVGHLASLGVHDIGESRDQEAAGKHAELADLDVRWHFVGRLQTNKCRSVASYADVVHSVDRTALVDALAAAVPEGRSVDVFVQVSFDDDPARGGAHIDDVPAVCAAVASADRLRIVGLMAVPPRAADPAAAYARLVDLAARVQAEHPTATSVSAGMSGDLEAAVAAGATHVRVGTALLGGRAPAVG